MAFACWCNLTCWLQIWSQKWKFREKNCLPRPIENVDNAWQVKTSKYENHIKRAYNMQNDEMILNLASELKLDNIWPSFGKTKMVENWLYRDIVDNLPIFDGFMAKIGIKCCPISILRPDLESSHHFAYYRPSFDMIFIFFCFPFIFQTFDWLGREFNIFIFLNSNL